MPLQWKKLSDYAIEDVTGGFRVSRSRLHGEWGYTAWRRVTRKDEQEERDTSGGRWEALCYTNDPTVAKGACEATLSHAA